MFRFIALVSDERSFCDTTESQIIAQRLLEKAPEWQLISALPRIRVFCAGQTTDGAKAHVLPGGHGTILGTIFPKSGVEGTQTSRVFTWDVDRAKAITESKGERLITEYWGRYVAVLFDRDECTAIVLKDPTGNLPCYALRRDHLWIIGSCLSDIREFAGCAFVIDWEFVRTRLATGRAVFGQGSGLKGVAELHGGERLTLSAHSMKREALWKPTDISDSETIEDSVVAAELVRKTARSCTEAWANCYEGILHRLSGGIDSSIVLGCLPDHVKTSEVTCLTFYIPSGLFDERPWARRAVTNAGCRHLEWARNAQSVELEKISKILPSTRPESLSTYLEIGPIERQLATQRGLTAVFSGDGGDSIFGRDSKKYVVAEYIRRHGFNQRMISLAADAAILSNSSVFKMISIGVKSRFQRLALRQERNDISHFRELVSRSVMDDDRFDRELSHPWFSSSREMRWALIHQLGTVLNPISYYDPFSSPDENVPEPVFPLNSQPLVEACLRIPMYIHIYGGRERGLARKAFVGAVPNEILSRQSKDCAAGYYEAMLEANIDFVRSFLLEGILTAEKLLDRNKVEQALCGTVVKNVGVVAEIFDHLNVEAWIRSSRTRSSKAAA